MSTLPASPIASISRDKEITVLLLGETGVGKSTWINGFANFLQYETLEEAEASPTIHLVPASFTMTDENYEERVVCVGYDENENTAAGQSATQQPQTYTFSKDGKTIRLIDTPGIGDVRGIEQDKKNFQAILSHIAHLDVINGVCILLKPNNARLNVMFAFCVKELLANLHRDACRNIVFCFTNARSTFYRPGDTLPALKHLIAESKEVEIPLDQKTLYCMDNESIRFLYAIKEGIKFSPDERKNYAISWDKSVAEVNRMLEYVSHQPPHDVQNTLSLNNARQTILALTTPLAKLTETIQKNMILAEDKKRELSSSTKSKEELAECLYIPKMEVHKEELDEPRTVCTSEKCSNSINVGDNSFVQVIEYTQNCHAGCSRGKKKHREVLDIVGHKSLKKCSAFNKKTGCCRECGCKWDLHKKTMEISTVEVIQTIDPDTEELLKEKKTAIEKLEVFLDSIDRTLDELRQEQKEITTASAKFACFLKKNAIRPYNDSIIAYLDHCINHEKNSQKQGGQRGEVLERLLKMKDVYNEEIRLLEKAISEGNDEPVTLEELKISIERLCSLKHNGDEFQRYMMTSVAAESAVYTEKRIEVQGQRRMVSSVKNKKAPKLGGLISAALSMKKQAKNKAGQRTAGGEMNNNNNFRPERFPSVPIHHPRPPALPPRFYLQRFPVPAASPSHSVHLNPRTPPPPLPPKPSIANKSPIFNRGNNSSGSNSCVNQQASVQANPQFFRSPLVITGPRKYTPSAGQTSLRGPPPPPPPKTAWLGQMSSPGPGRSNNDSPGSPETPVKTEVAAGGRTDLMEQIRGGVQLKKVKSKGGTAGRTTAGKGGIDDEIRKEMLKRNQKFASSVDDDDDNDEDDW